MQVYNYTKHSLDGGGGMLKHVLFLAKSALLAAIQTWSGDDIKLGLRSHLK